ncbi:unnamed protein product, partial [Clonostachys rosea]
WDDAWVSLLAWPLFPAPNSISGKEDSSAANDEKCRAGLQWRALKGAIVCWMITAKTRNHGMLSKVVFWVSPVVRQRDPLSVVEIQ